VAVAVAAASVARFRRLDCPEIMGALTQDRDAPVTQLGGGKVLLWGSHVADITTTAGKSRPPGCPSGPPHQQPAGNWKPVALTRGCPGTRSTGLLTTRAKQHEASIVERPGARVNQAWVDRLASAAALSYPSAHALRRRR
jgi:hypothetical protein